MPWGYGCTGNNWWLRSPGNNNNNAALVNNNGNVNGGGNNVNNNYAIRPDLPQLPETRRQVPAVRAGAKEPYSRPARYSREDKHMPRSGWTRYAFTLSGGFGPRLAAEKEGLPITDYEKVCDFNGLYEAHKKARLGKRNKWDVAAFEMDLANNLWDIKERLEGGNYTVSSYRRFMIHDPKTREIQALQYADRIVQHSLCDNVLTPLFEKRLIYDNCACRVGKGTHFGMNRLSGFLREHYKTQGASGWILKADVRKFFQNIDHDVLLDMLAKVIADKEVMHLVEGIVHSFNADTGKGLPMGNQTSQLFALYYLDPVDRLVKERLRVKHYTRYMDDMVLLHPDKVYLRDTLRQICELAADRLKLELNEKTQVFPVKNGVDYLGWHFYLTDTGKVVRKLRAQNKKRLKRRMKGMQKDYAEGRLEVEDIARSIAATNGHLMHGHTWKLREKIYEQATFVRNGGMET